MPVDYRAHPIQAILYDGIAAGTRAYAGNYQNTGLRPIMVLVTSQHTVGGAGQQARAVAYIDPTTPAASAVAYSGWLTSPAAAVLHGQCVFMVPPGYYYRVLSFVGGGGANALNEWWEVTL